MCIYLIKCSECDDHTISQESAHWGHQGNGSYKRRAGWTQNNCLWEIRTIKIFTGCHITCCKGSNAVCFRHGEWVPFPHSVA